MPIRFRACCRLRNEITDNGFSYTLGAGGVSTGSKSVLTINLNRCIQYAARKGMPYQFFLEEVVDLVHKVQLAYNENLKYMQSKGMLPLFDAGYINMSRQYLTIGVNGLVEAAEFLGIPINDNPDYERFTQEILGMIEKYNKKYRSKEVMFNCEMIPAENVGVKHAKWDKRDGYKVGRDCYNSYFYIVEDESLNIVDKFRLHGRKYIEHLTGGSALHMNLQEHLSREQYRHLLRVASQEWMQLFHVQHPEYGLQRLRAYRQAQPQGVSEMQRQESRLSDPYHRLYEACQQLLSLGSRRPRVVTMLRLARL